MQRYVCPYEFHNTPNPSLEETLKLIQLKKEEKAKKLVEQERRKELKEYEAKKENFKNNEKIQSNYQRLKRKGIISMN